MPSMTAVATAPHLAVVMTCTSEITLTPTLVHTPTRVTPTTLLTAAQATDHTAPCSQEATDLSLSQTSKSFTKPLEIVEKQLMGG